MKIGGIPYRTIWLSSDGNAIQIIDQTCLPHKFVIVRLETLDDVDLAIRSMKLRGAPLIGAAAAYGLWLALRLDSCDSNLANAYEKLLASRPTGVNLQWGLERMLNVVKDFPEAKRADAALQEASSIADEDSNNCRAIGNHGLSLLAEIADQNNGKPVQVLTHCNAGWLATVDYGTALSPIYAAHDVGISVHVWVDETRPRNQGASLTAWELGQHGVPHTVISDNAGGHLMQHGMVDLCITGADRTTPACDVCNKIGTYLKALAAHDNGIPFYVALPYSTIDWSIRDGCDEIIIEERDSSEITHITGRNEHGEIVKIQLTPEGSAASNYAFDVTPSRLVTGFVTERGLCAANPEALFTLYPEHREDSK